MTTVQDIEGREVDMEAATMLMDDDLREQIHAEGTCKDEQEFFEEYAKRHEQKHGQVFVPYHGLAW